MKKFLLILLASVILIVAFAACGGLAKTSLPNGAIPVLSNYRSLTYLLPGDYDVSKFEDGTWARYKYNTYVACVDGCLAVMPTHTHGSSSDPYVSRNETFAFENVLGCASGVYLNGEKIINEKCIALLHSDLDQKMLVFTTAKDSSCIYELAREDRNQSFALTDNKLSLDSKTHLIYFDWKSPTYSSPSEVYVITAKGVLILDTDDYLNTQSGDFSSMDTTALPTPDWWKYVKPNNATETEDGTVFIGEREGVIGIAPDGTLTYYPIDYLAAMREPSEN